MEVLHITPNSDRSEDGYEVVTLLANRINRSNRFSAIEKNGETHITGGFIINDTPQIRAVLDSIPKKDQYDFVKEFKQDPFVKFYLEED